jgi:hypothetical protein
MKKIYYVCFVILLLTSCSKDDTAEVTPPVTPPVNPEQPMTNTSYTDAQLKELTDGFDSRRDMAFGRMKGKALVRGAVVPSISSSGIPFYRSLSYSLIDFAANCFWNDERNQEANDALMENCDIYLDKLDVMRDGDSFYWAADELCRIIEFWGSKGSKKPGLLNATAEAAIYKMMWQWVKDQSKVKESMQLCDYLYSVSADFSTSNTWEIEGSENHHLQRFATKWQFSKFLKDRPEYNTLKYDDGYTAAQHYEAWNLYVKQYLRERARKGLFIEFANDGYGMITLKNIYNFYDFGDAELKKLSGHILDLFWATWAQEELNGVRGGSKARVYQGRETFIGATHFRKLAWYYLNIGSVADIKENLFTFISSDYRMPYVVMDMALDAKGKGNYEVTQRRLGLARDGYYSPMPFYRMNTSKGLVRYSYCTPEFIMGTFHCEALPEDNWAHISSQNRWMGIVFPNDPNSRIVPQCLGTQKGVYNQHWAVQSKGCMIVQRLETNKYASNMRVWISDNGLTKTEKDGWIFVKTSDGKAYTAIHFINGEYTSSVVNEKGLWSGVWYTEKTLDTPVLIETDQASKYSSFEDFQSKVQALALKEDHKVVTHTSLYGDKITFYADYSRLPMINGKTVTMTPDEVMKSPFVNSMFNTGVYTIEKGNRKLTLNFNE